VIRTGIIGASGYTGAELLRLLAGHPELDLAFATGDTQAGTRAADLYPSLAASYGDLVFAPWDPALVDGVDLVFLGLPHGASQAIVPSLVDMDVKIVDLAADFRLSDADDYPRWYGEPHAAPDLLGTFAYGLPELFRSDITGADRVAVPGCYPTAGNLALAPFVRAGAISTEGIVVDAASGVSGAGRPPKAHTTFCAVDEDFTAYGLLDHRHTAELDQVLGATVLFTPHLAPMNRGILATCYARPTGDLDTSGALDLLTAFYADEPFVVVAERSPSTKSTLGSNTAQITARVDPRTGWLVVIAAIDNLVKGASGQAVQCANIICDLDEAMGLPSVALYP
jgi:N-acetyl-gamma-glutamyl-phosphate reductase